MSLPSCICVAGRPPFDRLNDIFCALSQIDNPSPTLEVLMDTITNFDVGTPGQLLTPAWINAGTHGADWGLWSAYHEGIPDNPNTYSYVEDHPVVLPFTIKVANLPYTGIEGQGMTFDLSGSPTEYDAFRRIVPVGAFTSCVFLLVVKFIRSGGSANYNNDILNVSGARYTVIQHHYDPLQPKTIHAHSEGDLGSDIPDDGDWQVIWGRHDVSTDIGEIFIQDLSGNVIGADQVEHSVNAGTLIYLQLAAYLRGINQGTGSTKVKLVSFRNSDLTWPPYTINVPVPINPVGLQTGVGQVFFTWGSECQILDIQRQVNSGAWTTIASHYNNNGVDEYTDTGRANGSSVKYRVRNVIGSQVSAYAESPAIVINDGPFATPTWTDATSGASADTAEIFNAAMRQTLVCGTTGSCVKLRVWCKVWNFATGVKMGLYDSSNNLLGSGTAAAVTTTSESWVEVTLSVAVGVTLGTTYKIGVMEQSSGIQTGYDAGTGTCLYDFSSTYAAFPPNPYPGVDGFNATVAVGMGVIP